VGSWTRVDRGSDKCMVVDIRADAGYALLLGMEGLEGGISVVDWIDLDLFLTLVAIHWN